MWTSLPIYAVPLAKLTVAILMIKFNLFLHVKLYHIFFPHFCLLIHSFWIKFVTSLSKEQFLDENCIYNQKNIFYTVAKNLKVKEVSIIFETLGELVVIVKNLKEGFSYFLL